MRITRIEIRNFRSIRHLAVDLGETTVFVGPNNAGKTAILDALRIALTRRWGQRGTGFTEYDVHLKNDADDPKASEGVSIKLRAEESEPGKSATLAEELGPVVQVDPVTRRRFIILRAQCAWSEKNGAFEPTWEFLDTTGEPVRGKAAQTGLERFWRHLPVFYVSALRDASDEYSPRSQFWGRLLRSLQIPRGLEAKVQKVLDGLNKDVLDADPRLRKIADTLSGATRIAARDRDGGLDLRMAPLKTWDLLSKAEIILRNETDRPWLPLPRQGQGIQSLSVIFLFHAFVDHLLRELYEPDSQPVLALEEPETHLHPQAVRTLWGHVEALPGQKIVTSHSPYFVQHVPFRDLRLVRLTANGTEVRSLPATFATTIPALDGLDAVVAQSAGRLHYDERSTTLTVKGMLDREDFRALLALYGGHDRRTELERTLGDLHDRSSRYVTNDELEVLETFARRMRGEIFFAERWLIVEGQTDFLIVHALAQALNYDFDQHGIAVIDAQNNGNPTTFAALARAFSIPWLAVFDGDSAGREYVEGIRRRGFRDDEVSSRCRIHSAGDLEAQLVTDGNGPVLRDILTELDVQDAQQIEDVALPALLRANKTTCAAALAAQIRTDTDLAQRAPAAFRNAIRDLRSLQ